MVAAAALFARIEHVKARMIRLILAAMALSAVLVAGGRPADAGQGAPWCAVTPEGTDFHWDCEFWSVEACQPHVIAGNRGYCNQNPYYRAPAKRHPAPRRRR